MQPSILPWLHVTGYGYGRTDGRMDRMTWQLKYYFRLGSMMTFKIWAADCTVLAVQALLSQVKIVRLSYILKSLNLSALMRSPL